LNLLLAAIVFGLLQYLVFPLFNTNGAVTVPAPKKVAETATGEPMQTTEPPSPMEFLAIAEQNLFHPERRIPVEKTDEEAKQLPKPEFVLYGTLIEGDSRIAFMDDLKTPLNTPGRGKRQRVVKQGSSLSGFVLSEVSESSVTMARGAEQIVVRLDDQSRKNRGSAETTHTSAQTPQFGAVPAQSAAAAGPQTPRTGTAPAVQPAAPAAQPTAAAIAARQRREALLQRLQSAREKRREMQQSGQ
jgi:hypothetical protein